MAYIIGSVDKSNIAFDPGSSSGKYELIFATFFRYISRLNPNFMNLKTALLISSGLVVAGTGYWFFFARTKNTITQADRDKMKAIEFEV